MASFVLVHGFACDHTDWRLQAAALAAAGHEVIAPDLRGHGAAAGTPADCSIETYGADIAALLARKNLKGAILAGHSMGCRVVLQACQDASERIGALALVDGSWPGAGDPDAAERRARESMSALGYPKYAQGMFEEMFLAPSPLASAIVERAKRLRPEIGLVLFPGMQRWGAAHTEHCLSRVAVPLAVIQSTYLSPERKRVPMKPGETSPWLDLVRRTQPTARIEVIAGVGHFPHLEAAQQVNRLLLALA
ncbi:MAG: alpha/beta fold hydrolase [Burkholderiales bacterium]